MEQELTLTKTTNDVKSKKIVRDSNIELLRILCMIMIIMHHFCVHSGFSYASDYFGFNRFLTQFFYIGGKVGVDCFVLITGFFSVTSKGLKAVKPIRQWLQAFFYSIVIFIIFTATGMEAFTWEALVKNIFIVIFERWWFFSAYFVLLLISPALNFLFRSIPQRGYKLFLMISFIFWAIIPTFVWTKNYFTSNWDINSIIWFILLYGTGGYYKLYGHIFKHKTSWYFIISGLLFAFIYGCVIGCDFLGTKYTFFYENATYMAEMQTVPTAIVSVLMFLGFMNIKMKPNKVINFISGLTFGIYLLHDNKILREYLWKEWIPSASKYAESPYLVLIAVGSVFGVFILGGIIEAIRQYGIERFYMKPIGKLCTKIDNGVNKLFRANKESDLSD